MKKIFTKFLSVILTLSITLSLIIPGAAFAASGDVLIKEITEYDSTGKYGLSANQPGGGSDFKLKINVNGTDTTYNHIKFAYLYFPETTENNEFRFAERESQNARIHYFLNSERTGNANGLKYIISGKYCAVVPDETGLHTFEHGSGVYIKQGTSNTTLLTHVINNKLYKNTWYEFEYILAPVSDSENQYTFDVKYKNLDTNNYDFDTTSPSYEGTRTFNYTETGFHVYYQAFSTKDESENYFTNGGTIYDAFKNFKLVKIDSSITNTEAGLVSINSGNDVYSGQRDINFTLSHEIPGLEASDIIITDPYSNSDAGFSLTSDGNNNYTVTMNRDLQWTEYTFRIDPAAYDGWLYTDCNKVNASGLQGSFECVPTGFAMTKTSDASNGSELSFKMKYSNDTGAWPELTILMAAYDADGKMTALTSQPENLEGVLAGTRETTVTVPFTSGQSAKLFAINGWSGKVPHFGGNCWFENTTNAPLTAYSSAEAGIWAGEYDYTNNKVRIDAKMNSAATAQGVIYVYRDGEALSDGNIYVNCITTAADGSFTLDIPFDGSTFTETATYNVEFYSPSDALTGASFEFVTEADKIKRQEADILNAARAATTLGGLKQAILGVNELEQPVTNSYGNNNFDIFKRAGNVTEFYDKVTNKDMVFTLMLKDAGLSALAAYPDGYTALKNLFKAKAKTQYDTENQSSSGNKGNGGGGGGGGGVSVDNAVPGEVTGEIKDSSPTENTAGGGTAFTDMNGHWASEFASELQRRGIMNGYPDGSFGGEGLITRAEIAKTLVEAMDVAHGAGSGHYDIAGDEWHAPYIAGAAAAGIVTGFEDGSFGPDLNISRQDAAVMIYRALKLKVYMPTGYTFFTDDLDISAYASEAIRCLGDLKIITGSPDGSFNPLQPITRGEIAALMCRALDYIESH